MKKTSYEIATGQGSETVQGHVINSRFAVRQNPEKGEDCFGIWNIDLLTTGQKIPGRRTRKLAIKLVEELDKLPGGFEEDRDQVLIAKQICMGGSTYEEARKAVNDENED